MRYTTDGLTDEQILTLLYTVPLAPYYLQHGITYPGDRVHGNFPHIHVMFLLEPDDLTPWRQALEVNRTLPDITPDDARAVLAACRS